MIKILFYLHGRFLPARAKAEKKNTPLTFFILHKHFCRFQYHFAKEFYQPSRRAELAANDEI